MGIEVHKRSVAGIFLVMTGIYRNRVSISGHKKHMRQRMVSV